MNDETKMPISEREAEQQYPTQYWEGTKVKRSFDMTTDDMQDAYMRGREAKPCDEQIEAAAKTLAVVYAYSNQESGYYAWDTMDAAMKQGEDHWSYLTCVQRDSLMETAKRVLDAACKAVM